MVGEDVWVVLAACLVVVVIVLVLVLARLVFMGREALEK